jgi:A/G-specific adenine glycosylase
MSEQQFRHLLSQEGLSLRTIQAFRHRVYAVYEQEQRSDLPWRLTRDPYRIMVSEIMLQQTQVARVRTKYGEFLSRFPDTTSLAAASLQEVLEAWQGLGYNRRGKALKQAAEGIVQQFNGAVPQTPEELRTLPGIGPYTAGAIATFAFGRPELFIETNIRTVFLHLFFAQQEGVHDKELLPLIQMTLDRDRPREWYYALMDYGAMLKQETANPSRRSAHHVRQSPFKGSNREVRSRLLKSILARGTATEQELMNELAGDEVRVEKNLTDLEKEGFIVKTAEGYLIREKQ